MFESQKKNFIIATVVFLATYYFAGRKLTQWHVTKYTFESSYVLL